tara:strand:- start:3541 stop:4590 length:1050 start_codon:yes stop_codon:yes gene_type:complete
MIKYLQEILNSVDSQVKDLPIYINNKDILITGSTGFIGGYIAGYLCWLKEKYALNLKLTLIIRNRKKLNNSFLENFTSSDCLKIINYDLMSFKDLRIIDELKNSFDLIIHAASPSSANAYSNNKEGTIFINSTIIHALFNLLKNKKSSEFLFFSTSGIYGKHPDYCYPLKETTDTNLDHLEDKNIYLNSKLMGESILNTLGNLFGKRILILRPSINYGPYINLKDGRALSDFITDALTNKLIKIKSDGKNHRNYCYISDTLTGIFIALVRGHKHKIFNLAHDKNTSIYELAQIISKYTNSQIKVQNQKDVHLGIDFSKTSICSKRLKLLGWKTNVDLEDGLKKTIQHFE